jgi:predicted component of viral defense system (DUF524 family)
VDDVFRIETDRTHLSWNIAQRAESDTAAPRPEGRLAISQLNPDIQKIEIHREGWPSEIANDVASEVGPCLREELPYNVLLHGSDKRRVELRHRDPTIVKSLYSREGGSLLHGTIKFVSQIGRSRFSVFVDNKPEYDFEVEVFPSKLEYAADYALLLADLQDVLAGLVLEYLRSTFQFGLTVESSDNTRLEWILLLRHTIGDLERALHYVERHPHQGLVRERVATRAEKVRRADATTFRTITRGKGQGPKSKTASGLVLHSRLPARRSQLTWNTPEHRWFASQLSRIRQSLAELQLLERKIHSANKSRQRRILEEITNLEVRVAALQRLPLITNAKGSVPPGFSSLTLQARPGYREARQACLILLQGLRVNGGPVGLSVKELHCLYEYWCYLKLVRLVAKITGEKVPVREMFSITQNGLQVRLRRGTTQTIKFAHGDRCLELAYNPHYTGDAFIRPQNPDVVLTFRYRGWPTMSLVFDAKYRIDASPAYVKEYGIPGPPQDSMNALHRYRDSILEETGPEGPRSERFKHTVVECVALYPYADVENRFPTSPLRAKLTDVGIGAIPFLPRETRYLEEWLRFVLQRDGWSTTESTIPYSSFEQMHDWRQAEKESVLIGTLRRNARAHLEWIKSRRCYYTTYLPRQAKQLTARWVAIYSAGLLRKPGAITHWARVKGVEVKRRREIETPWPSRGSANEQIAVFKLGEIRELPTPIENKRRDGRSKSLSKNKWTTRLGIERATEWEQLSLETSMEWRLYEELRLAEVDFTLKPDTARLLDQDTSRSRTWFASKQLRVQYRGAAGFLLRTGRRDQYRSDLPEVVNSFISSPS